MAIPKLRFPEFEGEWTQKNLNSILKVNSGRDYKHLDSGDIPVFGTGGYMTSVNEYLSNEDAIGIGRKGSIDKPQKLNAPFWTVDTLFYCTTVNSTNLNFLYALFNKINWKSYDESTGVPSLSKKTIENITVGVPSVAEQERIGTFFKTTDKKIQLQQEKIELLNKQKMAYQLKFLNNKAWKTIRLGDYADIKGRLGWKGLKQEEYIDNGPFLIAGKHILRGKIQWDKCDMIPFERYEESMEIALESGDVIFSKDGSLGNPAYITNLPDKATINSTMMLVRVQNKDELDSNFVYHILNSHIFRKLIHLKVSGSSIPHLFQADMKEFSFAIPEDINEQKKIVTIFNLIDKKISLAYEKLDSLKAQKQAFMQQMFI